MCAAQIVHGRDDVEVRRDAMAGRRTKRRGIPGATLRRFMTVAVLLPVAGRAPLYARLVWALLQDERVPTARKAILGSALAYVAIPFDLIPDEVPILGMFDDLIVSVLGLDLFFQGIADTVIDEKLLDLGLDRAAFERDLDQIRRLVPRPVRRIVRHFPQAVDVAVDAARATRLGPRVRAWINKEGSFA
jgi:uncharacterized membrane protein YkvA (DUF1232 family)